MSEIVYYRGYRRKRSSKKPYVASFIFLIALLLGAFLFQKTLGKEYKITSPMAKETMNKAVSFLNLKQNNKDLENIVQAALGEEAQNFAVAVKSLKTGERYLFNEEKEFETASLYKLWVMAVVYQKIETGELEKTQVLSNDAVILNKKFGISSESAELEEGEVSWPIQDALEKMITISDNYSALLLTEKIGVSNMANFLKNYELSKSKVGTLESNPMSTASDVAIFFEKLYNGKLANEKSTKEMINLLKNQQLNEKLPKDLPENAIIAHKTGELGVFSHDAGIVYGQNGDYIIVVMSKTDSQPKANEKIAEISKKVFDYFEK